MELKMKMDHDLEQENVIICNDEIVFDHPLEDEQDDKFDSSEIFTTQSDPEIESLINRINRGSLVLQPDFQRYYVWDDVKASKLIESALLSIPLPTVYLSEEPDGKVYVIDGQQRLTSFISFCQGKFPNGEVFKLKGLKVFTDFNKKTFQELPGDKQDKILRFTVRTITFSKRSSSELKFEIFERLNTGSVALNDQELRNCIYRGKYNRLLKEMSCDEDFKYLTGLSKPDKRMGDIELVLRFSAFYHSTYLKYKSPMKKFLNADMERYRDINDSDSDDLKSAFKNALLIIRSMFDKNAFKRFYAGKHGWVDGVWETKKFNYSLFDVLMGLLCTVDKNTVFQNLDRIREGFIELMATDNDFIDAIELSTSSVQAVTTRFDKTRILIQSIIGINRHEPRLFSFDLKKKLFDQNPVCAICNQVVQSIDDSAVDHIKQYWTGGQTIPENARLTHRFCNWSRPRNEY